VYAGERFNAVSHLLGAALALAGLVSLLVVASRQGDAWKIVSFAVYGATLLLLYVSSTLYHSLRGRAKEILRKLDHGAIYLLIAGTYTPFALVTLRGGWGWSLLGVVWALAIIGIVQELAWGRGRRILSLAIYLLMGWLALIALAPLGRALGAWGVSWLLFGGAFYTVGMMFYALSERWRPAHGIWHVFVLGGSGTHFAAVLGYVA
jgi:hemolysin III